MSRIIRRGAVRQDLIGIAQYYLERGSPAASRRFRERAEAMFARLAGLPESGTRYEAENPAVGELRVATLPAPFRKFLVFYRPLADGVEIVRVLHGSRDLDGILADDLGLTADDDEAGLAG